MKNKINFSFNKYISLFLLISLFWQTIESSNECIITLLNNETFHNQTINNITTDLIYINGTLLEKKYILISSTNILNEDNSSKIKSPFLFISKNKDNLLYDYTSISQSTNFGTKLVLPYNYLDKDGFYLNITCQNICEEVELNFETLEEINLDIGEKFSYYSTEGDSFKINLNLKNYDFNDYVDNILFVVNGGEKNQLSMIVNGIKAKRIFGDVYYVNMGINDISKIHGEDIKIEIKTGKNVKFNFQTLLINSDDYINNNDKNIYEGEYNQYLALKGNRKECFNVQILNDEDNTDSNKTPREILILGKNNFQVNIICETTGETNKMNFEKQNEFDDYVVSDGLNCQSPVKKICLQSINDDLDVYQIHILKRVNEDNNIKNIRKMNEPLLNDITYKFILNEENSSDTTNSHINLHSHSQYYEKNNNINGLYVGIQVLYGIIKVYRDVCYTYPYCSLTKEKLNNLINEEEKDSIFETINGEGGYYSTSIYSVDDTYSMNTKQNIIIVLCKDNNFDGCAYQITYYNMQSYKKLYSGNKISKYLPFYNFNSVNPKKDNYELFLHKNKKLVLDLVAFSGDAYLTPLTQKDGCTFEEHHLGSNERRIITCSNDDENEFTRILFDVKANNKAAFYSIYALEKDLNDLEDAWPMEITIMESIHETSRIVKVLGKYLNDPPSKANSNFVTIFNSLNCDLSVNNLNTSMEYSSIENDDIIQDVSKASKRIDLFFEIKKISDFHKENKNCLYFITSFDMNNDDSSFIIPEAKPFRFKLDYDTKILRVNFPYAVNDGDKYKNAFLRVNLLNNIPIKIKIKIGFLPEEEHILYYSKNINIISNKNTLRKNRFTKIRISIETFKKEDEAIIDFSIRTNSPIPYSIKTEKYFSDLALTNYVQYYMTLIKQNSEGEILVNFKRNKGKIYAKLIRDDKLREVGGWEDRFILPNSNIDQRLLLPFDPYIQKVKFTKKETNNCQNYCYLFFGIDADDNLNTEDTEEDYFIPYNLYLKYFDENETDIKFIDLQNNEYISNYLNLGKNDYYKYHIYDFFSNVNITKVIFDFDSQNCDLMIGFNTGNFSDNNHTKSFSNKDPTLTRFEITKSEISKYYKLDEEREDYSTNEDLNLYIKIGPKSNLDNDNSLSELDLLYTLRVNSPNVFAQSINIINNIQPNNCYFTSIRNHCDYLMKLESFNPEMIIEIFALTNGFENIFILANAITSDDFGKYMQNSTLPEWPNSTNNNYHFPENPNKKDNYLSINYTQIEKKINNLLDPLLLIRVYGENNTIAKILSSMHNSQKNNKNYVEPEINREQIYSVEDNTLFINLPNDADYICKLIPRKGKGNITYHGKNYILNGDYMPLVFNSVKGGDNSLKIESINSNETKENLPFKFSLVFSKMKSNEMNQNEISFDNNNFAYENIKFPINYYVDISNIENNDISFDAFLEDFGYIYNDNEANSNNNRLKNYTEDFTLKSYLLTEDELNDIIKNNKKLDNIKKDNIVEGTFDVIHHSGNVQIPKDKINNFKKNNNNKKMYLYTTINKAYNNRNNYSFLKGKINLILPENPINKIPYDTYILGYIKGNTTQTNETQKVKHKYKLNLAPINDENSYIKLEFTSTSNDTKLIINNNTNITKKYENMDKYGKNIYIIKPERTSDGLPISIEGPIKEYDTEYTFKYSLLNNNNDKQILDKYPYEYEPKIEKCNISNTSISYIKFKKIKNNLSQKNCNCNYYISIYKKDNTSNKETLNNTISIKKTESPFATYKINNDNNNNEYIDANIHIYTKDDFYYEIIAEDKDTKELFGYSKRYPDEKPKDEEEEEKKESDKKEKEDKDKGFNWLLLILIILAILLVIISIFLCCKYCCNSKRNKYNFKKRDNLDMEELQPNETLYKNDF